MALAGAIVGIAALLVAARVTLVLVDSGWTRVIWGGHRGPRPGPVVVDTVYPVSVVPVGYRGRAMRSSGCLSGPCWTTTGRIPTSWPVAAHRERLARRFAEELVHGRP